MLYDIKEDSIKLDGTSMDYAAFGSGSRTMVLIPGLSLRDVKGSGASLAYMYRKFTKDHRIYCFDRRRRVPVGFTVADIARDIAFGMDELGLKNACVLGVSQGGMAAQYLALDRPDLVDKVVLGVTTSRSNSCIEKSVARWVDMAEHDRYQELTRDIFDTMYPPEYVAKYKLLMPLLQRTAKPKDPRRFIRLAKACLTCSTYERLGELHGKALVLGAGQDKVVTAQASNEMAAKIGCRCRIFEELWHSAYEDKAFNEEVYGFFTDNGEHRMFATDGSDIKDLLEK